MDPSEFGMSDEQMYGVGNVSHAGSGPLIVPQPQPTKYQATRPIRQANPLDEIESRLTLAQYYRAVLNQPLFSQNDAFSARVQSEVTEFVMGRMSELVGAGKKPGPGEFSPEEVQALKALAQRLLAPEAVESASPGQTQPTPGPSISAPRPAPRIAPRAIPAAPVVNPVTPPVEDEVDEGEVDEEASPEVVRPPPVARKPRKPAKQPKTKVRKAKPAKAAAPPPGPANPPSGYIPIPQGSQMSAVTQMRAMETVAAMQEGSIVETSNLK